MKKILILYPKLFSCKSKFERKISKITSSIDNFEIVYPDDPHNLINSFFQSEKNKITLICDPDWQESQITHAVVFDDGEEFPEEIKKINSYKIPYRLITIKVTRVINIKKNTNHNSKKSTKTYEYIGRGSYWGNPHSMYENGDDREEVIRKFKYDFDYEKFPNKKKSEVYKLAGKSLGCFCKPLKCHGDILADYLNSWDDGK